MDGYAKARADAPAASQMFDPVLLEQARRLLIRLARTDAGRSGTAAVAPSSLGRRRVLVPGGSGRRRRAGDLDLLQRARRAVPEAFIIYAPNPDGAAANRGRLPDVAVRTLADDVSRLPLTGLIAWADEVHTAGCAAGLEALLRGCPVSTHGQPFYAGRGLTTDYDPPPEPRRPLGLEQLAATLLLSCPRYRGLAEADVTTADRAGRPRPAALHRVQGRLRQGWQAVLGVRLTPQGPRP